MKPDNYRNEKIHIKHFCFYYDIKKILILKLFNTKQVIFSISFIFIY